MRQMSAWSTIGLAALLALFPFAPAPMRAPIVVTSGAITILGWRRGDSPAGRLGVFTTVFLASIVLGSRYAQLSFALAILAYLAVVRGSSRLRGDVSWLRWGRMEPAVWALSVMLAAGAAVTLLLWQAVTKPDLQDLIERFVPDVGLPLLIAGGLMFALVNAAVEEIAYRGIVLDALRESGFPLAVAIAVQAAAFGAIHLEGFPRGLSGVSLAVLYGALLGIIRIRGGGMLAPSIAHVLTDLVIVAVLIAMSG